jgi:hypothetical protein
MPFEHALVSLDDGRRLSAAENPPLHNSREPIGSSPNWGPTRSCRTCSSELVALRVTAVAESPAKLLVLSRSELAVARLVATGLTNRDASFPGDHSSDIPRMRRPCPRRPANTTTTSDNARYITISTQTPANRLDAKPWLKRKPVACSTIQARRTATVRAARTGRSGVSATTSQPAGHDTLNRRSARTWQRRVGVSITFGDSRPGGRLAAGSCPLTRLACRRPRISRCS